MNHLLSIQANNKLTIDNNTYDIISKASYSLRDDSSTNYFKINLSNRKTLVIIPDDNIAYLGEIVSNLSYQRLNDNEIIFNHTKYHKTGAGYQIISEINFGNPDQVEGECIFEDFESEDGHAISLGIFANGQRADIVAQFIQPDNIEVI